MKLQDSDLFKSEVFVKNDMQCLFASNLVDRSSVNVSAWLWQTTLFTCEVL
jgi:hypothetical protein